MAALARLLGPSIFLHKIPEEFRADFVKHTDSDANTDGYGYDGQSRY